MSSRGVRRRRQPRLAVPAVRTGGAATPVPPPVHRFIALVALLAGCAGAPEPPATRRLIDLVAGRRSRSAAPRPPRLHRARWRFDDPDGDDEPLAGWMNEGGVAELDIRDGRLRGETTAVSAIVFVVWHDELDLRDQLHAVDIEPRVSDGTTLAVEVCGGDLDLDNAHADGSWALSADVLEQRRSLGYRRERVKALDESHPRGV